MARVSDRKLPEKIKNLSIQGFKEALKNLDKEEDAQGFFYNFLTPQEQIMLAKRLAVGILLAQEMHYRQICDFLKVTPNTVQSVKREILRSGRFKKLLEILSKKATYQTLIKTATQSTTK